MTCSRCHGLLCWSECHDHEAIFLASRCLACGDIQDRCIQRNRCSALPRGWGVESLGHKGAFRRNLTGKESAYDQRH